MALPLIPIALGAAAGVGGGMLTQGLLSGTKKDSVTYAPQTADVYHAPYETYQPTSLYAPQQTITMPSYQVSLGSSHSPQTMTTKQTARQDVTQDPTYTQPVTYPTQTGATQGISDKTIMIVALIAGLSVVGYGVLS